MGTNIEKQAQISLSLKINVMKYFTIRLLIIIFICSILRIVLYGQTNNFHSNIISKSENAIRIEARFYDNLPDTLKPNFLVALPGEGIENIDVRKVDICNSYVSSELFTDEFISKTEILQIRGYHLLNIEIDPFIRLKKYIPISGIVIEVQFSIEPLSESSKRLHYPRWDQIIKNLVVNPEDVKTSRVELPTRDEDGAEYLVICHDLFLESCQEIVDLRIQQGISTMAVPLSVAGSSVGEIEAYINNAYNTWTVPPVAVLLIGDMDLLPAPVWQGYAVSDNIYADVNEDELPDIFFSRIPVQNISELEVILQKIISHETNPPTNPDYYQHPISCADHTTSSGFGWMVSEIFNGWYQKQFNKEPNRQYTGLNPGPAIWPHPELYQIFGPDGLDYISESPEYLGNYTNGNADGINAGLNNGAMTLFSYTHGSSVGWQPPNYHLADLTGLTEAQPNYLFAINSLNGQYHTPYDCIAEAFLKHPHGSLGVIAPTDILYTNGTEWYTIGIIDGLWDNFYPANNPTQYFDFIYPCAANTSAKYFLEYLPYPINPQTKSVLFNLFHYFGEPWSVMYDQVPQELTVSHPEGIMEGETQFPVTADEGATVALVLNDEICSVEAATGSQVWMPVLETELGDTLHLTVTKQNHIRYHAAVPCYNWIGMGEKANSKLIEIYPNPADEFLYIRNSDDFSLSVFNSTGRQIVQNKTLQYEAALSMKAWPAGIYYFIIESKEKQYIEKVVVR